MFDDPVNSEMPNFGNARKIRVRLVDVTVTSRIRSPQ